MGVAGFVVAAERGELKVVGGECAVRWAERVGRCGGFGQWVVDGGGGGIVGFYLGFCHGDVAGC